MGQYQIPPPPPRFEGLIPHPSFTFATNQPQPYQTRYRVFTQSVARSARLDPVQSTLPPWAPIVQPDRPRERDRQRARHLVDIAPVLHLGSATATVEVDLTEILQPTRYVWPVRVYQTPRILTRTLPPFDGAPAADAQTDALPPVAQPSTWYYARPIPRVTIRSIRGPAGEIPIVPILPALSVQPSRRWYSRGILGPLVTVPSFTGPTVQQTFVFPLGQPPLSWLLRRLAALSAPPSQLDGAEVEAAHLSPSPLPIIRGLDRVAPYLLGQPPSRFEGAFVPPVGTQTYVFPLDTPSRSQWYVPRITLATVGPRSQLEGATAIAPQLFPIPLGGQPTAHYWRSLHAALTKSLNGPLDTIVIVSEQDIIRGTFYIMRASDGTFYITTEHERDFFLAQLIDRDFQR